MASTKTYALFALLAIIAIAAQAAPADAAFPGQNGKLVFSRAGGFGGTGCLYTANPDGSAEAPVTCDYQPGNTPRWSADGSWIGFIGYYGQVDEIRPDGTDYIPFVFDSGGTTDGFGFSPAAPSGSGIASPLVAAWDTYQNMEGPTYGISTDSYYDVLISHSTFYSNPAWSPDGKLIAFTSQSNDFVLHLSTIQPDGLGIQPITNSSQGSNDQADWSPDGQSIAFTSDRDGNEEIYIAQRDGTGQTRLTTNPAADQWPRWSPDGTKLVFQSDRDGAAKIYVMDPDGSDQTVVTTGFQPDWQPILKGYARPRGASPLHTSLVLAYPACSAGAASKTHAPPLNYGACAPTAPISSQLTVGTPDANSRSAKSIGYLDARALGGNPAAPPDEADVALEASIQDVRQKADLSDYTGQLEARIPLQVTDKQNTPYPGGQGPGTAQPTTLSFAIPCTATTADATVGSDCLVATTTDTLVPGTAAEGKRAIWQIGQVAVYDGGSDNLASTPGDNTLFEVQGVFVP